MGKEKKVKRQPEDAALEKLAAVFKDNIKDGVRVNEAVAHSQWIITKHVEVYIRLSFRMVGGERVSSLDIATIVANPSGQGIGTRFIDVAHAMNPLQITFVENVLFGPLESHLKDAGWVKHSLEYCYYKDKRKSEAP